MISLSKTTQSTSDSAALIIKEKPNSKIRDGVARVSRSATLDGGATIEHLGFADGDRRLEIAAQLSKADSDILWSIFTNETFINISTIDGFFYGSIDRLNVDSGKIQLTILIEE